VHNHLVDKGVGVADGAAIVQRKRLHGLLVGFAVLVALSKGRAPTGYHSAVGAMEETMAIVLDVKVGRPAIRSVGTEDVQQEG
jgi:hypothetical protein